MKFNLRTDSKGFTLIEMVIVIAVIGILMGIAFGGVRNVQGSARDTKRQSDLKTVQTYLELYYNKFGHYPGDKAGATGNEVNVAWGDFRTIMETSGIVQNGAKDIPNDPLTVNTYYYSSSKTDDENTTYVLGTKMERGIPSSSVDGNTTGKILSIDSLTCKKDIYCITN